VRIDGMRADRLVALLLLLQQRQSLTAAEAAAELEVSERTARRDFEALGMAGLPVYSQQGRGGGWRLLGGARTDLSGLNAAEARALFLAAGPASKGTPEVKAALRKLVRALPETLRPGAEVAAGAVVVDPRGWGRRREAPRPLHLAALTEATAEGLQVRLGYADRNGQVTERVVSPLGLVDKGTTWYLVAGTGEGLRTFRVARVRSVEKLAFRVERPEGFELAAAWEEITKRVDDLRSPVEVTARADPAVVGTLLWFFEGSASAGEPGDDGWVPVRLRGARAESVAAQVAPFGKRVVVTGPPEAREHLARLGSELVAVYAQATVPGGEGS
jgi:predicted DNA-binding transcriptional regulator YafY